MKENACAYIFMFLAINQKQAKKRKTLVDTQNTLQLNEVSILFSEPDASEDI